MSAIENLQQANAVYAEKNPSLSRSEIVKTEEFAVAKETEYEGDYGCEVSEGYERSDRCGKEATRVAIEPYTPGRFKVLCCDEHAEGMFRDGYSADLEADKELAADRQREAAAFENLDREEERRLEKVFPLESPRLQSLTESVNVCAGFGGEECGDQIPDNLDLCPTHQREEDQHYTRQAQEQDRREAVDANSQYQHIRRSVRYVNPELAATSYTPKGCCFLCNQRKQGEEDCKCRYCDRCERWWIAKERGPVEEGCAGCKATAETGRAA